MTKQLTYAGIGPRKTPLRTQHMMSAIAGNLSKSGWLLRSGHAEGADQAFEAQAGAKEIYIPWEGFNGAYSNDRDTGFLEISPVQIEIAIRHHPAWDRCSDGAQMLLCRNVPIILGQDLDDPVDCVITWLPKPDYKGGTRHALNIASTYGVPVFDIREERDQEALTQFLARLESERDRKAA